MDNLVAIANVQSSYVPILSFWIYQALQKERMGNYQWSLTLTENEDTL